MSKVIFTLALIALFAVASASRLESINNLWGAWKVAHGKQYTASEETHRFAVFQKNLLKIAKLNVEHKGAKFAVNQFADLTSAEFEQKYTGLGPAPVTRGQSVPSLIVSDLPESIDWREKGAVTPVKNQGACGSCWAFGAIGAVEGLYFVNNGELLAFSEQQLVDCVTDPKGGYVYGCNGGWHHYAIDYAAKNGVELETDYPYTAKTGTCHYDSSKGHKVATGYTEVTPKNADQLKAALTKSPVAIAIQANQSAFQFYKTGVLSTGCGAAINHAVLAVGYQQVNGKEALIVKNSWGKLWGAQGYILISTDADANSGSGVCGIYVMPIAPK